MSPPAGWSSLRWSASASWLDREVGDEPVPVVAGQGDVCDLVVDAVGVASDAGRAGLVRDDDLVLVGGSVGAE
jgi:hypothetical protein